MCLLFMGLPAFQADLPAYVSPADYLRLERDAAHKHEYIRRRNPGDGRGAGGPQPALL